jgi:hypothetical protein
VRSNSEGWNAVTIPDPDPTPDAIRVHREAKYLQDHWPIDPAVVPFVQVEGAYFLINPAAGACSHHFVETPHGRYALEDTRRSYEEQARVLRVVLKMVQAGGAPYGGKKYPVTTFMQGLSESPLSPLLLARLWDLIRPPKDEPYAIGQKFCGFTVAENPGLVAAEWTPGSGWRFSAETAKNGPSGLLSGIPASPQPAGAEKVAAPASGKRPRKILAYMECSLPDGFAGKMDHRRLNSGNYEPDKLREFLAEQLARLDALCNK